jgi:hypothetical protein
MRTRLSLPRVLLPHTCTQDGWFLQPERRPARLPRRTIFSSCKCRCSRMRARASPYTYSSSTHRFPMSAHLSRLCLFQRHLRSLFWLWVWVWDWVHTPPHTLLSFSPPSFHTLVRDGQTSPHKPRLVVPHSTCPSLSPSPPAHSFIIGPAVIKNTHSICKSWHLLYNAVGVRGGGRGSRDFCDWHTFDSRV